MKNVEVILPIPSLTQITSEERKRFVADRLMWCKKNIPADRWMFIPPTRHTCIFSFDHSEDAIAFKLRFGV